MNIETAKNRISIIQNKINEENRTVWEPNRKLYESLMSDRPDDLHSINLIWATIRTMIPELFFMTPEFRFTAKHRSYTEEIRKKNEALFNMIIARKDMAFSHVIKSTILAAHLSMGIVTWGCDSVFVPHPRAGQPMMTQIIDPITRQPVNVPMKDLDGSIMIYPAKLAIKDSYYVRRVRAQDFYPDLYSGEIFEKLEYYAIAQWMTKKKIKDIYKISTKKLEGGEYLIDLDDEERERQRDRNELDPVDEKNDDFMRFRVYTMFDREEGKKYTFCLGHDKFLDITPMPETEPVALLKFNDKLDDFYPIHEVSQLDELQVEIEIAATMRSEHMKRSGKKVLVQEGSIPDASEASKLESPYSHEIINVARLDGIRALDFGTCDASIYSHEAISTDQFNQVAGTSASRRGGASPKRTATAEIIQDKAFSARQSEKRILIAEFLSIIGNGLNNVIQDTLSLEYELSVIGDNNQPYLVQYIPTIDKDKNFECVIDIAEMTAPNEETERIQWISLLDEFVKNPLAFSDETIIKETLRRFGIENKEIIEAFMRIAMKHMEQQAAGMLGKGGGGGSPPRQRMNSLESMMSSPVSGGIMGGGDQVS